MMKRIQKGPVKGISLKLQEEVRTLIFLFNILYSRKERERWTLFPRSQSSKSTTSTSRTRSSARWSRRLASRSLSPARERDSPETDYFHSDDETSTAIIRNCSQVAPYSLSEWSQLEERQPLVGETSGKASQRCQTLVIVRLLSC